jgi:hypothetical protein
VEPAAKRLNEPEFVVTPESEPNDALRLSENPLFGAEFVTERARVQAEVEPKVLSMFSIAVGTAHYKYFLGMNVFSPWWINHFITRVLSGKFI